MSNQITYLNRDRPALLFSKLAQAVAESKQARAKAEQWIPTLKALTQKGVKGIEIEESGIIGWLETKAPDEPIERDTLLDQIRRQTVTIKEVILGQPKFGSHRQPGGTYQEILFVANSEKLNILDDLEDIEQQMMVIAMDIDTVMMDTPELPLQLERRRTALLTQRETAIDFNVHHFSNLFREDPRLGRNLLAHARITQRGDTFFIEEIQSDWGQHGRENNWNTAAGFPKGPLVTNTEAWSGMVLRRLMQMAARNPEIKRVAWITETMRNGWVQDADREAAVRERNAAYTAKVKEVSARLEAEMGLASMTKEQQAAAKTPIALAATAEATKQGFRLQSMGLNEFYLNALPKLANKALAGSDAKVELSTFALPGSNRPAVTVPSFTMTDSARAKLAAPQPLYSRGNLAFQPREAHDEKIVAAMQNQRQMLGNLTRLRLFTRLYDTATGEQVAGSLINKFVQLSLSAEDPVHVMDHEVCHYAQKHLLDSRENQILRDAFAPGTILNLKVAQLAQRKGDTKVMAQILANADEAAAEGFAYWHRGELDVSDEPARGLFGQIEDAFKIIFGWVRKHVLEHKLQTVTDVFASLASGELAERQEQADTRYERIGRTT